MHCITNPTIIQTLIDNFQGKNTTEVGVRGTWLLYTYPVLEAVFFDKSMKHAWVSFQVAYEYNLAFLQKKGDKWEIINARRFLIQ